MNETAFFFGITAGCMLVLTALWIKEYIRHIKHESYLRGFDDGSENMTKYAQDLITRLMEKK